jgi:hypothetical protein
MVKMRFLDEDVVTDGYYLRPLWRTGARDMLGELLQSSNREARYPVKGRLTSLSTTQTTI